MSTLLRGTACEVLGCTVPVVLAGMGGVSRAELVTAVSNAGGFGFLGMVRESPQRIATEVDQVRQLGHERFGVNIIPAATDTDLLARQVEVCIALKVPVVSLFWDIDTDVVARFRDAGILVVYQVGSVEEAKAARRAGAGMIIAQGREAGGHVRGVRPLRELLPDVARAVDVPVLAAGGLATGGDLVAAFALGAEGIVLGTALMATEESFAHAYHKQRLVAAEPEATLLTESFHINWPPEAPVRVLRSAVTSGGRGQPDAARRTVIGEEEGRLIYLFSTDSPLRSMSGDFESMALYAGTGVGRINGIVTARERLDGLMAEAEELLRVGGGLRHGSSPVCYAHEMAGDYMGLLDREETRTELRRLARDMREMLSATLARDAGQENAPPFPEQRTAYARWVLILEDLAGGVDDGRWRPTGDDLPVLRAALLRRLGALLPRLEESAREALLPLRTLLEGQGLVALRRVRPAEVELCSSGSRGA